MKVKHQKTALFMVGCLAAGAAYAEGDIDIRATPGNIYEEVDRDAPRGSNDPGQTLAGIGIDETMTSRDRLTARISELEQQNAQLEGEMQELEQANAQLEEERSQLTAQLEQQGGQDSEMRAQLEQQRADLEAQQAQLEEERARLEEMQAQQGQQDPELAQLPPPVTPELMRELQQTLRDRGQNPGPVDGIWGPRTHQALQQFQSQEDNLEANGQLGPDTLAALNLEEQFQQRAQQQQQEQPRAEAPQQAEEQQQAAVSD